MSRASSRRHRSPARSIAATALGLSFACCGARPPSVPGYDLGSPVRSFGLPKSLREVSGMVALDAETVACVQDEKGTVYVVDARSGEVRQKLRFGDDADYEGLARIGDDLWVLRSDGLLLQLLRQQEDLVTGRSVRVAGSAGAEPEEFEGLCYDARSGRLLVAPKHEPADASRRPLFAVDPDSGRTDPEPFLVIDRDRVRALAGERLRLRWSEVAVHPETGDLWLLSAVDRAVVVVGRTGDVLGVHVFAQSELPQPEAATFLPGGEFVVASEGAGGAARLHVYRRED